MRVSLSVRVQTWHHVCDTVHTLSGLVYMRCHTWFEKRPFPASRSHYRLSLHNRSRAWIIHRGPRSQLVTEAGGPGSSLELDVARTGRGGGSCWWLAFDGLQTGLIIKAELSSGKSDFNASRFLRAAIAPSWWPRWAILLLGSISYLVNTTRCHIFRECGLHSNAVCGRFCQGTWP